MKFQSTLLKEEFWLKSHVDAPQTDMTTAVIKKTAIWKLDKAYF